MKDHNVNLANLNRVKSSDKNSNEKLMNKQKSILFSDCGNCWQTTKKQDEIVYKRHLNLKDSKNNRKNFP